MAASSGRTVSLAEDEQLQHRLRKLNVSVGKHVRSRRELCGCECVPTSRDGARVTQVSGTSGRRAVRNGMRLAKRAIALGGRRK